MAPRRRSRALVRTRFRSHRVDHVRTERLSPVRGVGVGALMSGGRSCPEDRVQCGALEAEWCRSPQSRTRPDEGHVERTPPSPRAEQSRRATGRRLHRCGVLARFRERLSGAGRGRAAHVRGRTHSAGWRGETGLDLVGDEKDAGLVADRPRGGEFAVGRDDDSGLPLDRLDEEGDGVLADARAQRVLVAAVLDVAHPDALATAEHDGERIVVVGAVTVLGLHRFLGVGARSRRGRWRTCA